jgi:hypothetical protein
MGWGVKSRMRSVRQGDAVHDLWSWVGGKDEAAIKNTDVCVREMD